MRTPLLDRVAVESEPPSRGELSIALATLCAILVAFLVCKLASDVRGNTNTIAPSSRSVLASQDA